jgi:hypothetical protein
MQRAMRSQLVVLPPRVLQIQVFFERHDAPEGLPFGTRSRYNAQKKHQFNCANVADATSELKERYTFLEGTLDEAKTLHRLHQARCRFFPAFGKDWGTASIETRPISADEWAVAGPALLDSPPPAGWTHPSTPIVSSKGRIQ